MNSLCPTCRKMLYRTDACKGDGVECGRTDGGSKKSGVHVEMHGGVKASVTPHSGSHLGPTKSTAARKDVPGMHFSPLKHSVVDGLDASSAAGTVKAKAGTQAPPVDTKSIVGAGDPKWDGESAVTPKPKHKDRHKPGYQAQKQREYRARKKNGH